jgi:hypothetical protein
LRSNAEFKDLTPSSAPQQAQVLFDMIDKTMTKIRSVDTSALTDEEKTNFQTALTSLKTGIDNYQAAPPSQPSRNHIP